MVSLIVLLTVFTLIAVRRIGSIKLQIWQIMLGGALSVLFFGEISIPEAVKAINLDVILFLFGVFIVGRALELSGYLSNLTSIFFKKSKSTGGMVLFVLLGMGFTSALLMNDTIAIIGTPVVLYLAQQSKINPKLMLLALAFSVTIGSVMSPIGNPQNLLIALNGNFKNPFLDFIKYLFLPTLINLFIAHLILKAFFNGEFHKKLELKIAPSIKDQRLAILSRASLILLTILIFVKIFIVGLHFEFDFRLTYIALLSALPIIIFSERRKEVIMTIDWHTLIFFAAMFVLMESVWDGGVFQKIIADIKSDLNSMGMIFSVSVLLSQLISNVPLVALYLPVLMQFGASSKELIALATGSTIAGNLFILGAASNVIIIQNAEKKNGESISFLEFARIGIPLTAINIAIYWLFFKIF